MAQYSSSNANSRRSPEVRGDSDSETNRDSHDLSLAQGRGRESLLDNLLLSFDKIGDGFNTLGSDHVHHHPSGSASSPYLGFNTVDEVEDNASLYSRHSRRTRTGSAGGGAGGYNLQYPQRVRPDPDYGYESETGSFGVTYGGSAASGGGGGGGVGGVGGGGASVGGVGAGAERERDSHSRSRGGGRALDFDPLVYDSAPAPSIRTRNRTPSPPRSPRLARRPSNKSVRSLRNQQEANAQAAAAAQSHFALPPLPAFANPPSQQQQQQPSSNMTTPSKQSRPGFFRRVFGGGSSNSIASSNNSSKNTSSSENPPPPAAAAPPPPATPPAREVMMDTAPPGQPQQVITKKSSFFRRRKKSVSDVREHPMPPPPVPAPIKTPEITPVDVLFSSPGTSSSLRNAMKDYLPSPGWNHDATHVHSFDDRDLPEPSSYLANGHTIRKVTSSDPIALPGRHAFFDTKLGRSPSNDMHYGSSPDSIGKLYKKDTWNSGRGGTANGEPSPLGKLELGGADRPSSSPFASIDRTFFHDHDDEDKDYMWPHTKRSNGANGKKPESITKDVSRRRPSVADSFGEMANREPAILNVKDYERQQQRQAEEEAKRDRKGSLNLDTKNLEKKLPRSGVDQSWFLSTASPATHTPTVTLQRDGEDSVPLNQEEKNEAIEEDEMEVLVDGEFTEKELDIAQKIFDGDEEFMVKDKAAAWLGDPGHDRTAIRKAYLALFDWHGVNILSAMRIFCGRLVFKGEAQQVDRLMDEFARRWCTCNPNNGFKGADVVHTILYSILLLNTDLHMADIPNSQRMTRGQFLKNTMATIRRVMEESSPDDLPVTNRSATPYQPDDEDDIPMSAIQSLAFPMPASHKKKPSLEFTREFRGSRMSRIGNLSPRLPPEEHDKEFEMDGGLALVKSGVAGGTRMWETQVEVVLKDFYKSIQAVALPLHGSPDTVVHAPHTSSLSVWGAGGMLRRSNSTISKAPSELSVAGRQREMSAKPSKDWTAKNRSRQRVYNGSFAGSSRTSLEDRSSVWSPSASSTWSKYSLNKTQTSMSVDSLGTTYTHGDYQQSIGFANALSHAIIREEAASGHSGSENGGDLDALLDGDEELELHGAPWAKEGLLKHKHHLESVDKRAKNRNWTDSFAVIQRGYMRLFQFPSKSTPAKPSSSSNNIIVGGGNWMDNAEPIGTFLLRQTIASALPPPGYSKSRPHVWALSLPSGAVHFFEVGTSDIVKEFVSTANYWSARLSKEPLTGGVSNVEYGWSDALLEADPTTTTSPPSSSGRPSLQMSVRSSFDQATSSSASHHFRGPRLPGDKITIKDWTPPAQTMLASSLKEADQLKALEAYVANVEEDLRRHNELRAAMLGSFRQGSVNQGKAQGNWERKSSYLLKEIIKFRTYIETLAVAGRRREEFARGKREKERERSEGKTGVVELEV